ncbi:MAG TPA: chemotaxis protein CheD [Candidatus Ozemobacteraceae bacterium]
MQLISEHGLASQPRKIVRLDIGQLFACREAAVIYTLLGSCVSACLFDPVARVSGMNHILLPGQPDFATFNDSARYGVNAMEVLINEMTKLGAMRSRLTAKVFGGGQMLATLLPGKRPGMKNVEFVLEYLQMENIRVLSQDVGGPWARVLKFHTNTFEVYVKKIRSHVARPVCDDENRYEQTATNHATSETNITLFDSN